MTMSNTDYLKYYEKEREREKQILSGLRENLSRLPARTYIYIYTQRCIFLPGTLLTIVTEMERNDRQRGKGW